MGEPTFIFYMCSICTYQLEAKYAHCRHCRSFNFGHANYDAGNPDLPWYGGFQHELEFLLDEQLQRHWDHCQRGTDSGLGREFSYIPFLHHPVYGTQQNVPRSFTAVRTQDMSRYEPQAYRTPPTGRSVPQSSQYEEAGRPNMWTDHESNRDRFSQQYTPQVNHELNRGGSGRAYQPIDHESNRDGSGRAYQSTGYESNRNRFSQQRLPTNHERIRERSFRPLSRTQNEAFSGATHAQSINEHEIRRVSTVNRRRRELPVEDMRAMGLELVLLKKITISMTRDLHAGVIAVTRLLVANLNQAILVPQLHLAILVDVDVVNVHSTMNEIDHIIHIRVVLLGPQILQVIYAYQTTASL